jgi:hypothetical protein
VFFILFSDLTIIIGSDNHANHDYIIPDLSPYTWYTVQVRAATIEGDQVLWGNWTNPVETRTSQTGTLLNKDKNIPRYYLKEHH